ncbi:MAG: ScnB-like protein [Pseudomonadota bacterium]
MTNWHDMGGFDAGEIDETDHAVAFWEKRVDAMMVLLYTKGLFTVDSMRRVLEDLGPESFETMSYYERWMMSLHQNLLESGALSTEEIADRMAQVRERGATYGTASAAP